MLSKAKSKDYWFLKGLIVQKSQCFLETNWMITLFPTTLDRKVRASLMKTVLFFGVAKNVQDVLRKWTPREIYVKYQNFPTQFGLLLSLECSVKISRKSFESSYPVFLPKSYARFSLIKVPNELVPHLGPVVQSPIKLILD